MLSDRKYTWHQCWIKQSSDRRHQLWIWWCISCPQNTHLAHFSSYQTSLSNVRDNQLWCLGIAWHTLSSVSHWRECWSLRVQYLGDLSPGGWRVFGAIRFSVARHDTDVTSVAYNDIDIKELRQQGPPPILWYYPALCISPHSGTRDRPHPS